MRAACSFEVSNPRPQHVAGALKTAAAEVGRVAGGMIFLSGGSALQAPDIARATSALFDAPVVVACGSGVMTERGEHDNVSTAVGLVWAGGRSRGMVVDVGGDADGATVGSRVREELLKVMDGASGAVGLFAQPDAFPTSTMDSMQLGPEARVQLFGGAVTGRPGALLVDRGQVRSGSVVGLAMLGIAPPVVRASVACRLLGTLQPVTQAEGGLILRIGKRSAIDELKDQASRTQGRDLLLVAVEVGRDPTGQRPRLMMRGIRGIHEARGGLMVSDELLVGTPVAFAVRDPAASRADLEVTLREMAREMAGGTPRFGVYVDCAGRGPEMYGVSGVDVGLIRGRWPSMPLAGLKSAFEIGPGRGGSAIHMYSGVLSVFSAPS
jgi:small ligand-binding sensory domain FIST